MPTDPSDPPALPDPALFARTLPVPGGVRPIPPGGLPEIPGYEVLSKLGEGGMGVVYHARHVLDDRAAALKLMLADAADPTHGLARFLAEAEAAAAVRHPHVVGVYEFGHHAGRPFLALEYLSGGTLAARLAAGGPLAPRAAAALVEKLARGVQAAHAAGIVHRDLKPTNVLFDARGEPRVTDFGLAKRAAVDLTATQAVMGSPAYMAPEQARGEAKFIGPAADVWGLGVILYECLTGARPFPGLSAEAVLRLVISADPVPLRVAAPGVPRPLDLICRKCLEKNPADRYLSADDLADDLRRYAAGEPVRARAPGVAARVVKWARRDPSRAAAYALTAAVVSLVVVSAAVARLWRNAEVARADAVTAHELKAESEAQARAEKEAADRSREEADRLRVDSDRHRDEADRSRVKAEVAGLKSAASALQAEASRGRAEIAQERAERFVYARLVGIADRDWQAADLAAARAVLRSCAEKRRGWEWRFADRLTHADRLTIPVAGRLAAAAYSPDGKWVAAAEAGGTVRVFDAITGAERLTIGGEGGGVRAVAFSPDGSKLVTAGKDGTARVWDATSGKRIAALAGHATVVTAAFSPDGAKVVTAGGPVPARVWDVATGKEVLRIGGEPVEPVVAVLSAAFNPDGTRVVTAGSDGAVRIWDAATGNPVRALTGHLVPTIAVYSPDGSKLATAGIEGKVFVWSARTGTKLAVLAIAAEMDEPGALAGIAHRLARGDVASAEWHNSVAFTRDGTRAATAGADGLVRVWDTASGREVRALRVQRHGIRSVAFGPDPARLLTAEDGAVRVWDLTTRDAQTDLPGLGAGIKSLALSPDLRRALVEAPGGAVAVWDAATGRPVAALDTEAKALTAAFTPDGTRLATAGPDGTVRLWDAATGGAVAALRAGVALTAVAFTPGGERVAAGTADGAVRVWDVRTKAELTPWKGHTGEVRAIAFNADGTKAVTTGADGTVRGWDAAAGREVFRFDAEKGTGGYTAAAISPDGAKVATARADGEARVWDAAGGGTTLVPGGGLVVVALAFSPDGTRVATGCKEGRVQLWDAASGADVFAREVSDEPADLVAFSADGSKLVGGGRASRVVVWDATPVNAARVPRPAAPAPRPKGP